jgi:hypothetical protein
VIRLRIFSGLLIEMRCRRIPGCTDNRRAVVRVPQAQELLVNRGPKRSLLSLRESGRPTALARNGFADGLIATRLEGGAVFNRMVYAQPSCSRIAAIRADQSSGSVRLSLRIFQGHDGRDHKG